MKIENLTKAQEKKMPEYAAKYIKLGLNITPLNHEKAKKCINAIYAKGGIKPPITIEFVASPQAVITRAAELMGKTNDAETKKQLLNNFCYGQQDANWLAFYQFFRKVCGLKKETEKLTALIKGVETLHWYMPFNTICICSERPVVQMIEDGVLHNENGAAIEYADGFSVHSLWGVRVPKEIACTPKDKLNLQKMLAIANADVRTVALRKIGFDRLREHFKVETLHTYKEYELVSLIVQNRKIGPYLRMQNPTTGEVHFEGVGNNLGAFDENIKTCQNALMFRRKKEGKYKEPLFKA